MIALLAAACLTGSGLFTAPLDACTPGAYARLTRAQACASKDRPALPAAERRKILRWYRLTRWDGTMGELDHRQPFWAGGLTDASNVWPERSVSIPNPKDRLEDYTRRRVCAGLPHPMTLRTVHRIFATDWRVWYQRYVA